MACGQPFPPGGEGRGKGGSGPSVDIRPPAGTGLGAGVPVVARPATPVSPALCMPRRGVSQRRS